MDLMLKNKKALITGSSKGIGYAIAQKLCKEGCLTILNSRNKKELEIASRSIPNSIGIQGDMTKENDAKFVIKKSSELLGDIDILICNVGSGKSVKPGEESLKEWKRIFELNLWSATNMIEVSKDYLFKTKGNIVCISSICGIETIENAPLTYSSAKAALNSYVKGISRIFAKNGVRINAIAPGNILFEGSVWESKILEDKKSVENMLKTKVPLNKFGRVEDIANLACFLSSSLANNVTGAVWKVDGGQSIS